MAESAGSTRKRGQDEPARQREVIVRFWAKSTYDVFLSFSGSDDLLGFADSLYRRLVGHGFLVFRDDGTHKRLPLWVYSSIIYIPILSRTYAHSFGCLDALAFMVEDTFRSGGKKEILPVFYDMERHDVNMERTSLYSHVLDMHRQMVVAEKVEQWKKALVEAGKVKGWELSSYESEGELIALIIEEILRKLKVEHNYVPKDLFAGADLLKADIEPKDLSTDVDVSDFIKSEHISTGADPLKDNKEPEDLFANADLSDSNMKNEDPFAGADPLKDVIEPKNLFTDADLSKSDIKPEVLFTVADSFKAKGNRINAHAKDSFQVSMLSDGTSELEDSQVSQIISLLDTEVMDVRIVGIHGRDGIGKTALAKIVYNKISLHFDTCSFLVEIEEMMQQPGGVQCLHTKLIFDILKREYEIASAFRGVRFLKEIFRNMKVLLVLDDVESGSLLKDFVGAELDWFGSGSRIIVTSKQRSVLQGFVDRGLAHTYDVIPMDDKRAFDLFWQYAKGKSYKLDPDVEIANKIVKAAEGLPLLVKVFGSFLHGKGRKEWIEFKDLIQQFQEDYLKILRIIYEALDKKQKQMYLDVACLLPDTDYGIASYMWHDYDRPHNEIEVLCRMSLIKMDENKIGMHSMLRCLARKIIYEGLQDPGTCVRSYIPAIAQDTKMRKMGTDQHNAKVAAFEIPPNTPFISLSSADIGGKFADALLNVRWLHWQGCPRDFKAILIHLENLVILDLSWSKVKESWGCWKGVKMMEHLKVLNLTGCADLLVTPNFSCCPNLEILILQRCSRLVYLDPSINILKLLVTLNLKFCSELSMLPEDMDGMNALRELLIDGTSVRELPESIGKLVQLQILSATNCSSLIRVPGSVCELRALSVLALDDAKIFELPESIGDLGKLRRLSLRDCRGLGKLPESIGKVEGSLVELDISGTGISRLPDSTKNMRSLKVLKMDSCFIKEFPSYMGELIDLEEVHASWCRSLEGVVPSDIWKLHSLRELRLRGTRISSLPLEIQFISSLRTLDLLHCDILKELPPLPSNLINLYVNPHLMQNM